MQSIIEPIGAPETAVRRLSWRAVVPILALLAAAIAYRDLAFFDPGAGRPRELEGADALFFEPGSSSPWLVYAVTLWLLARRWSRLRDAIGTSSRPFSAGLLLASAAALCLWGRHTGTASLQVPSLSLLLLGSGLLMGGAAGFRALLLPALFLLLAVPIPTVIVNQIMYPMQLATARWTTALLGLVGADAVAQGDLILRGGRIFQVIESCSGLRTMETLVMAAAVYRELLQRGRLQGVLLVLTALLVGLLTNQLRVFVIVLNPYSDLAAVHTGQGLVMIVVGVLLLAAVDAILARLLPAPESGPVPANRAAEEPHARWLALAGLSVLLCAGTLAIEPWQPTPRAQASLSTVSGQLDGWSATRLRLDTQFLGSVSFSEWIHRRYVRDDETVDLLIGGDDRLGAHTNLLSTKTAVPGPGWTIVERGRTTLESSREAEVFRLRKSTSEALVYRWHLGVESRPREILRSLLALDRSELRRPGRALVVRLCTQLRDGDAASAEARLRGFASRLEDELSGIVGGGAKS
jgi:exosortase